MDPFPTSHTSDPADAAWTDHPVPHFRFTLLSDCPQLTHAVFTRHGGTSPPPYDSLNTSSHVGDIPGHVNANLAIIREVVGAEHLLTMNQVHGAGTALVRSPKEIGDGPLPSTDAAITDVPGVAVMVKQADCQGVILLDPYRNVLSVIHCGWRGNAANILSRVVLRMTHEWGCDPDDLLACIGPSLGPCCAEFVDPTIFPKDLLKFRVDETHFDLKAVSRHQLLCAGLRHERIQISTICTRCRTDLFFSYRGEGTTGRFATVAMLTQGGKRHAHQH